ncbi:MAG: hypothetical protein JNL92_16320 [Opitutaceae bacterium]|nr:hypothetical protein [Opitutaceae bacterium]
MVPAKLTLTLCLLFALPALRADPEADVRDAVTALSRASYAWETTVRQRFTSETREPRLNPNAPIEVRGRTDPQTFTEITQLPTRDLPVPVTAVFRGGEVVGLTPAGWQRRTEMRPPAGADRPVAFGGQQVRAGRVFAAARQVTARRPPNEDLLDLLADLKSFRSVQGLVVAELPDRAIERLWGDDRAKRAPDVHGSVIFQLSAAGLTEYHIVLAIGFPNSRTRKTDWSIVQWSTRFSGLGATVVEPPPGAVQALDDQSIPR